MPIVYLYISTIMGVVIGLVSGWGVAMISMMLGYGAYAFLLGTITWVAVSVLGFLIGLSLYL